MGTFESTAPFIELALKNAGVDAGGFISHRSACDPDSVCQEVLGKHPPSSRPRHIFYSVIDRAPVKLVTKLERLLDEYINRKHDECEASLCDAADISTRLGKEFLQKAVVLLKEWRPTFRTTARCSTHQKLCKPFPAPSELAECIWVECAGTPCIAWSKAGSKAGWLHESAIPVLIWARLMSALRPTCILHECTIRFPIEDLMFVLGTSFDFNSIFICPRDLGMPSIRQRRYTLIWDKTSAMMQENLSRRSLASTVFCEPTSDCMIFCLSSPEVVTVH